jgi:hypothetical protein
MDTLEFSAGAVLAGAALLSIAVVAYTVNAPQSFAPAVRIYGLATGMLVGGALISAHAVVNAD